MGNVCPICARSFRSAKGLQSHRGRPGPCHETDLELLDRYCPVRPVGKCWIWQGPVVPSGWDRWTEYGCLTRGRKKWKAHRWVYTVFGPGPIPDGWDLDHTCETTLCVQPRCMDPLPRDIHEAVTEERRHARRGELLGPAADISDEEFARLVGF